VLARAKNGTGKTGAYSIPCIEKIDRKKNKIQSLIVVPTRELALQTAQICSELGKHMQLKVSRLVLSRSNNECAPFQVMVVTGGTDIRDDIYRLQGTVHLIVATPGRILDLMEKRFADMSHCKQIVLDEADKLLSQDFQGVLDRVLAFMPRERQIMLFSATFPRTVTHFVQVFEFTDVDS
jgi:ATP-dependent RNA helicase DDX6/DHH1